MLIFHIDVNVTRHVCVASEEMLNRPSYNTVVTILYVQSPRRINQPIGLGYIIAPRYRKIHKNVDFFLELVSYAQLGQKPRGNGILVLLDIPPLPPPPPTPLQRIKRVRTHTHTIRLNVLSLYVHTSTYIFIHIRKLTVYKVYIIMCA